jgi:hypothetical protein
MFFGFRTSDGQSVPFRDCVSCNYHFLAESCFWAAMTVVALGITKDQVGDDDSWETLKLTKKTFRDDCSGAAWVAF